MDNVPSPDSACPDLGDSRVATPSLEEPKKPALVELVAERSPDSGVSESVIPEATKTEFEIGQVVWVWMTGYPIWPGMIAPAPAGDRDEGKARFFQSWKNLENISEFFLEKTLGFDPANIIC